jgi:hypothetical protein
MERAYRLRDRAMQVIDQQPDETGAQVLLRSAPKKGNALSRLKRELTEEEVRQPGAQKMLLEELERVKQENTELQAFRDRYHDVDKKVAVLQTERRRSLAFELISSGTLTVGSAAVGLSTSLWSSQPAGWEVLIFGAILLLVGVAARWVRI